MTFFVALTASWLCPGAVLSSYIETTANKIDAVVLTTAKDTRAFIKSIQSGLKHLVDVNIFYVVTPDPDKLLKSMNGFMDPRVKFINEGIFPFHYSNVSDVMFESVRQKGLYPMTGSSQFEKTIYGRIGWFLQQLLKLYAGRVLGLNDFVLLDSDIVWFKDIKLVAGPVIAKPGSASNYTGNRYYYTTSSQYHGAYLATLPRISGVPLLPDQPVWRSGVVHHMTVVKAVMDDLITRVETLHGIPFWKVLLNIR